MNLSENQLKTALSAATAITAFEEQFKVTYPNGLPEIEVVEKLLSTCTEDFVESAVNSMIQDQVEILKNLIKELEA